MQTLHDAAQAERWPFVTQNKRRALATLPQILEWFLWGVFMGAGWYIANWLLAKVLH
jgi:hypothetical protein